MRQLGSPLPQLHGEWARPSHIGAGTRRTLPHLPPARSSYETAAHNAAWMYDRRKGNVSDLGDRLEVPCFSLLPQPFVCFKY